MEDKTQKVSRRGFLQVSWSVAGVAALGQSLYIGLRFLAPRQSDDPFGGLINAGLVDDFPLGSVPPFDQGRFFLVRQEDGGFLALYHQCTHLGCSVSHSSHDGDFQCACHGAAFRLDGKVLNPPAPRPLDLFPVSIENGAVTVNTAQTIERAEADPSYVVYPE